MIIRAQDTNVAPERGTASRIGLPQADRSRVEAHQDTVQVQEQLRKEPISVDGRREDSNNEAAIGCNSSGKDCGGTFTLSPIPMTTTGSLVVATLLSQRMPPTFRSSRRGRSAISAKATQPPSLGRLRPPPVRRQGHPGEPVRQG